MGRLIIEVSFELSFGESEKLDLEPVNKNGINGNLVRLVVTHTPLGCLSAFSEVARFAIDQDGDAIPGETCWVVSGGSIVPVQGANFEEDDD